MLRTADFNYHLPKELIATHPLAERNGSRLMVVNRADGSISHAQFTDFAGYVQPGDLCVFNNTRVMPARYHSNDGRKELLRLDFHDPLRWRCLVKPGRKLRAGHEIEIGESIGRVEEVHDNGDRTVVFSQEVDTDRHGSLALPHYMERDNEASDRERYQTVFGQEDGAVAAPTAGLHFTEALLESLPRAFLTLHVGAGTFKPVQADVVTDHTMHSESYLLSEETVSAIRKATRTIAIGTTVTRVLEHCARSGELAAQKGETSIFIYPPYQFRVVDALLTNFHLPQSTLLMLVSALAGRELIMEAYRKSIESRYRFFSYGDAMLIL